MIMGKTKKMEKAAAFGLVLLALVATVMSMGLFSCKAKTVAQSDTLIFAIDSDPGNDINTITTGGRYDLSLERLIYSPLLNYYGPDDITFLLAESVEVSGNPTVATYHLRKDVLWSDGTPFTADDVIFTFEHIIKADYANGHDNFVFDGKPVTFVKTDDWTLELHYPVFVANPLEAATAEHFIMPKHIYSGDEKLDDNPKNQKPVGTGPYQIVEYAAGQYFKLAANEHYFLGAPKIKNVIFQIVSDVNSAKLALQKGEIHAYSVLPPDAQALKKDGLQIFAYPEDRVGYLCVNLVSERVSDINLRKAVFFALNRTEMNDAAYLSRDYYEDAYSILPRANPFYTDSIQKYDQDTEMAKDYLALAADVPTLRIAYTANTPQQEVEAMVIQQNLKDIGVSVEIQALDSSALYQKLQLPEGTTDFDMFLGGYIMGIDASNYTPLFFSGNRVNYAHLNDPALDALWTAGSIEADSAKRLEIYHEIQRRIAKSATWYPIVTNKRILAVSPKVGGVEDARLIPIYTFEDMSKLYFQSDK